MSTSKSHPLPAVAALISGPSQRVLIVRTHKWGGLWGVPAGKIEYGESVEAALRREMREEVGLELHGIEFAFVAELIEDPQFYRPMHFVSLEFVARSKHEDVVPNEEIAEYIWLSPNDALKCPINPYTRTLLEWCLERGWPDG